MIHRTVKSLMVLLISLLTYQVIYAQDNKSYASDNWLNWQESEVSSIPAFDLKKSISIHIDPKSQLQWYVDPNTITLGEDRIVRYVVLGVSKSGTVNAMYEGVFCKNGMYKVYARTIGKTDQTTFEWRLVEKPEWKNISDLPPYSHQRMLAKQVMCEQSSSPSDVNKILQRLKKPYYEPSSPAEMWN